MGDDATALPPALDHLRAVQEVRRTLRLDGMRLAAMPGVRTRATLDAVGPVLSEAVSAELDALPAAEHALGILADAAAMEAQATVDTAVTAFREAARAMLLVSRLSGQDWLGNRVTLALTGPRHDPLDVGTADPSDPTALLMALEAGAEVVVRTQALRDAVARRRAARLPAEKDATGRQPVAA